MSTLEKNHYINISIIIPVYNDHTGLRSCLKAISLQSAHLAEIEVIVVDNASDTSVEGIINEFYFAKYSYEKKPGSFAARNKGISLAKGKFFVFLDADCVPREDWLSNGIKALKLKTGIIGGDVRLTTSNQPSVTELYQAIVGFQQKVNIEDKKFSATANLFIRSKDALKIGTFDESLLSGGDREWCWKANGLGFTIHYCSEVIVETPARRHLSDVIKQTRRVAGGRRLLAKRMSNNDIKANLNPHRSIYESTVWILKHPKLSFSQRVRVFTLAGFLKAVTFVEKYRLILGSQAERV